MKLLDTILLAIATGLLFIGIDQVLIKSGNFADNYWLFMLMIGFLGWFQLRKIKRKEQEND
jgi:hypothetical protein